MNRPKAWWIIYDVAQKYARGQEDAERLTDEVYRALKELIMKKGRVLES